MKQHLAADFFSAFLRLYPVGFRECFGAEMMDVFCQGYADSKLRSHHHLLVFLGKEYASLVTGASKAHLDQLIQTREGPVMKGIFYQHWDQKPLKLWESVLAGIPYFFFALTTMLPVILLREYADSWKPFLDQLYLFARQTPPIWWALTQINSADYWSGSRVFYQFSDWAFAIFILAGLLFAWHAAWPDWSATYTGFGLTILALLVINLYPSSNLAMIAWLLLFIGTVAWKARKRLLNALLTALPFTTMFFWLIAMDSIIGWQIEAVLFISGGLLMTLAVWIGLRSGQPGLTLGLLLLVWAAASGAYAYFSVYYTNFPHAPGPTPLKVFNEIRMSVLLFVLFTAPIWLWAFARLIRPRQAQGG
jgi:hypothetical protein